METCGSAWCSILSLLGGGVALGADDRAENPAGGPELK